jgi:hypothetical protein
MSLFAVDPSLLVAPDASRAPGAGVQPVRAVPSAVAAPRDGGEAVPGSAAAAWRALLPTLVSHALARGHVRSAALLHDTGVSHLPTGGSATQTTAALIDASARTDVLLQRRQLAGEALAVPSLTTAPDGTPRFLLGVQWAELAHPIVQAVVLGELAQGVQVELRNFLDEVLRETDRFVDLEPAVGVAILTALSAPSGCSQVVAVQTDATLHAVLSRNVAAAGASAAVTLCADASDIEALVARDTSHRLLMHTGRASARTIAPLLASARDRAIAIACTIDDSTDLDALGDVFDAAGLLPLMLVSAGDECELAAFDADAGATYCFALSPAFVASVESGA